MGEEGRGRGGGRDRSCRALWARVGGEGMGNYCRDLGRGVIQSNILAVTGLLRHVYTAGAAVRRPQQQSWQERDRNGSIQGGSGELGEMIRNRYTVQEEQQNFLTNLMGNERGRRQESRMTPKVVASAAGGQRFRQLKWDRLQVKER